ncbi:hypothetical protein M153_97760001, partial [Pseudoloma neurophilia]
THKLLDCLIELSDATKNVNFLKKSINFKRCILQAIINLRFIGLQLPFINYYDIFTIIHFIKNNQKKSNKFLETDFYQILQLKKFDTENNQKLSQKFYDQLPVKKILIQQLMANENVQRVTVTLLDGKLCKKYGDNKTGDNKIGDNKTGDNKTGGNKIGEQSNNIQSDIQSDNKQSNNYSDNIQSDNIHSDNIQSNNFSDNIQFDDVNEISTVLLKDDDNSDLVNLLNNTGKLIFTPVHIPYFLNDQNYERLTWTFFILSNNDLIKFIKLNGDFIKKEIILDLKLEKNEQLKFVLVCDQYFGCDTVLDMRVG